MLKTLRDRGLKAVIFEAGNDTGGTWRWNVSKPRKLAQQKVSCLVVPVPIPKPHAPLFFFRLKISGTEQTTRAQEDNGTASSPHPRKPVNINNLLSSNAVLSRSSCRLRRPRV